MSNAAKQLYYGVIDACSKAANTQLIERVNILGSVDPSFSVSLKPRTYDIKIVLAIKQRLIAAQQEFNFRIQDLRVVSTRVRSAQLRGYTVYSIALDAVARGSVPASNASQQKPERISLEVILIPRVGSLHILQT